MAVKIRLQRKGRKKAAYYYIVIADSRSPRDGRFIEKIGSYNPIPAIPEIHINEEKAIYWLDKGAQPTKTVHDIFSKKGILYRKHLLRGIVMGIVTPEEAENKYSQFLATRADQLRKQLENLKNTLDKNAKITLEKEAKVNELRAKKIQEKRAAELREKQAKHQPAEEESPAEAEELPAEE